MPTVEVSNSSGVACTSLWKHLVLNLWGFRSEPQHLGPSFALWRTGNTCHRGKNQDSGAPLWLKGRITTLQIRFISALIIFYTLQFSTLTPACTSEHRKVIFLASRATIPCISCWSSGAGSTASTGPSTSSLPGAIPRATVTRKRNGKYPFRCVHIMHFNSNLFFLPKAIFQNDQAHLETDRTVETYLQDSQLARSKSSSWPVCCGMFPEFQARKCASSRCSWCLNVFGCRINN